MLVIFTEKCTPRIEFTFKYVFQEILGLEYSVESNIENFKNYKGPKIAYHKNIISDNTICAASLLFENDIKPLKIVVMPASSFPVLFPTEQMDLLGFDIFASVFYMISRYEEYLPYTADEHGRFPASESLASKNNFLKTPVVNQWVNELKNKLNLLFPTLKCKNKKFQFINTFDVDNAYAYKGKPIWRFIGANCKSLLVLNFQDVLDRISVVFGKGIDPYDTYGSIIKIHNKYKLNSIVFFLLGNYGALDKNLSHKNKHLQKAIKNLYKILDIGIHPSYASNSNAKMVGIEKNRLEKIINHNINKSRQHYLKIKFPDTYRELVQCKIEYDYTLSFVDDWGFRAGTCVPFYFFDLTKNEETNLMIYPTILMDATLNNYLKLSPDKAIDEIKNAIDIVREVDGTFVSLWHNESLSENKIWKGWSKVYEGMVKYAVLNDQ